MVQAQAIQKGKKSACNVNNKLITGQLMNIETLSDYISAKTLLGSIGENHRYIKTLLKSKVSIIKKVQSAMDEKARTKTPLDERQQRSFYEFTGLYAKEGGKLQQSLMRLEYIQNDLHTENSEAFMLSLLLLQRHQKGAITSLRLMIASAKKTLDILR